MKNFLLLTAFLLLILTESLGQTAPGRYLVFFTDKANTPYSISEPDQFLSQRAIDRRDRYEIPVTEMDLPVDPAYLAILAQVENVEIIHHTKWFNAATIATDSLTLHNEVLDLPMISGYKSVQTNVHGDGDYPKFPELVNQRTDELDLSEENYGAAFNQIAMHNGQLLHEAGFQGQGMQIAVLDAGFEAVNTLPIFDSLYTDNRLLGTRDFVDGDDDVYHGSTHGTYVLSTMAGILIDSMVGTAPLASYYLLRTENTASEYVTEEDNWVVAAEYADSLGVDVINSSLGYSLFDDPSMDHSYEDMDGNTTRISIAADIAASRGILVVTSAGNSGSSAWHYITAPADADSALTVGAVQPDSTHISFSSYGPTFDGRVKPNLMAQGYFSVIADVDGGIQPGNGTSFSSPILCGVATCLWQAHIQQDNMQIIQALEECATHYTNPTDSLGYGIPDAWCAHENLPDDTSIPKVTKGKINAFPNPFTDKFLIQLDWATKSAVEIEFIDISGRKIIAETSLNYREGKSTSWVEVDGSNLPTGIIFVHIKSDEDQIVAKMIKQH